MAGAIARTLAVTLRVTALFRSRHVNTRTLIVTLTPAALLALAGIALASPGLDVRSVPTGPILPGNAPAGPPIDSTSQNGQWFLMNNGLEDFRTHEFHDNIDGHGGGPINHLAIDGRILSYNFDTSGNVMGYNMNVRITNNTNVVNGTWAGGPNMHGEDRLVPWQNDVGTMRNVRFSAHWADDGNPFNFTPSSANVPSINQPQNTPVSPGTANTFAKNYDALAWYSYTSGQAGTVGGSYQVPTWDFGDIAVGATASRIITFSFYDALNASAVPSLNNLLGHDLLIARSNDIKIASYFQDDPVLNLVFDSLTPYPPGGINPVGSNYGNSSVFYDQIPSPGTLALAGLGGVLAWRRRRA